LTIWNPRTSCVSGSKKTVVPSELVTAVALGWLL